MKIQLDWLREYIDPGLSTPDLDHLLTMSGLEVEGREEVVMADGRRTEVLTLNVTPNRGYCLSHIGVARELAALLKRSIKLPTMEVEKVWGAVSVGEILSAVNQDPALCPRYAALVMENVTVKPSPQWLIDRLHAVGLRPINNVVDVTNYVLMEYGQPLHAFDHALLAGRKIIVRRAAAGEAFAALDGSKHKLDADALVIADGEKPVALAGIMGGANSEVAAGTQTVALESACFDPSAIRRASKKYGLRSDSSYRFERGVDIEGVIAAQNRAALLIRELAGGTIRAGRIDLYPAPRVRPVITLRSERIDKILGGGFDARLAAETLEHLGMDVEVGREECRVRVPSWRPALTREIDLIEEIARLRGYNNFPVTPPTGALSPVRLAPQQKCARKIREVMSHSGYAEAINYSFVDTAYAEQFKSAYAADGEVINLSNPISADLATMRTSVIPGLLKTAFRNLVKGQKPVKVFEVGKVFIKRGGKITEKVCFSALVIGIYENSVWKNHAGSYDFYDLKGALETVFAQLDLIPEFLRPESAETLKFLNPGKSAICKIGERTVGFLGEVDAEVIRLWGLGQSACVFEIDVDAVTEVLPAPAKFSPLARFPEIYRDISILVGKDVFAGDIAETIRAVGARRMESAPGISKVELFDHFDGKKLESGKKSLTFALAFQSPNRTLTDDEVNPVFDLIVQALSKKYGAALRVA